MSKVIEIINAKEPLNKQLSTKVNERTYSLLHKVFQHRKREKLSADMSEFLRQCITVALLMDNPEEYVPEFQIPNIETLLENPENETETQTENEGIPKETETEIEQKEVEDEE